MAIENDYTSQDYNSYFLDIAELETFVSALDGFYNLKKWNKLTDIQKENIMLGATDDLNTFCFKGEVNTSIISPNNMSFPVKNLEYKNGVKIKPDEIPVFVKQYVAERALEKNAQLKDGSFYDGRIKKNVLGKLSQEFHSPKDSRIIVNSLRKNSSFSKINFYVCGLSGNFKYIRRV